MKKIFVLVIILIIGVYLLITSKSSSIPSTSPLPSPAINPSLAPSPTPSPTPTPLPSPTPSPTPIPSPVPTPTPTPSLQPEYSSEEIHGFIEKFSNQYGLDPNKLRHIAICESGFNPLAENLSYQGLYQFSPNTWKMYRNLLAKDPNPDLRLDAFTSVETAAYVMSLNQTYIWPNCSPD
jgi:transglycosylase-like protein with SLT domain